MFLEKESSVELSELVVKDTRDRPVRLGDLWRDRPAVLVFLRHFG